MSKGSVSLNRPLTSRNLEQVAAKKTKAATQVALDPDFKQRVGAFVSQINQELIDAKRADPESPAVIVGAWPLNSNDDVEPFKAAFAKFKSKGYEGSIVKDGSFAVFAYELRQPWSAA